MKLYRFGFENKLLPSGVFFPDTYIFPPGRYDGQVSIYSQTQGSSSFISALLPESQSKISISYYLMQNQQGETDIQKIIEIGNINTRINISASLIYTYLDDTLINTASLIAPDVSGFNCIKALYSLNNQLTASVSYGDRLNELGTHIIYNHQNTFFSRSMNIFTSNKYIDDVAIDCDTTEFSPAINCKRANIISTGSSFSWRKLNDSIAGSILQILNGYVTGSLIFTESTSSLCTVKLEEQFNQIDGMNFYLSDLYSEDSAISSELLVRLNGKELTSCSIYPKKLYTKNQPMTSLTSIDSTTFNSSEFQFKIKQSTS